MKRQLLVLVTAFVLLEAILVNCEPCENILDESGNVIQVEGNENEICEWWQSPAVRKCVESLVKQRMDREKEACSQNPGDPKSPSSGFLAQGGTGPQVKEISLPACKRLCTLDLIKKRFFNTGKLDPKGFSELCSAKERRKKRKADACLYNHNINCNVADEYRTIDGSCNNIANPAWGKSLTPLERLIDADYADGIQVPRTSSVPNTTLPSARKVSLDVAKSTKSLSPVRTMLHMTFGQILDHDMDKTANTQVQIDGKFVDLPCGTDGCNATGPENTACFPIEIPAGDPDYTSQTCMKFVRTQEVMPGNCGVGPREQLNQITSYLDASFVYGSTEAELALLRDTSQRNRGLLKTTPHPGNFKPLLPKNDVPACRNTNASMGIQCFRAGDGRVNEHVGLTALHTMYHRYHNFIESELHRINPTWSGKKKFQEARKILTAQWEHVVLNEYVSTVIGSNLTKKYDLIPAKEGHKDVYNSDVNAQIGNAYATAAFRFGHSQIPGNVLMTNKDHETVKDVPLSQVLRDPNEIYKIQSIAGKTLSTIDAVMNGHIAQQAETTDAFFDKQISFHMFTKTPHTGVGMDLAAINVQRGRDHGLPAYNKWRKFCGLEVYTSFDGMTDIPQETRNSFKQLYANVDDVDLYIAGVSETHLPGAAVGPTFGCIIAQTFQRVVYGDRFWFERPGQFSLAQLKTIRKSPLSSVFCAAGDNVDNIQKYVLVRPREAALASLGSKDLTELYKLLDVYNGEPNIVGSCHSIHRINFNLWRDKKIDAVDKTLKGTAIDRTLSFDTATGMVTSGSKQYTADQYSIKFCNFMSKIAENNNKLSSFYTLCNVDNIRSGSVVFEYTLTFSGDIPLSDSEIFSEMKSGLESYPDFGLSIATSDFTLGAKDDLTTIEIALIAFGCLSAVIIIGAMLSVCYFYDRNRNYVRSTRKPNSYYNYGMDPYEKLPYPSYHVPAKLPRQVDEYPRQWKPKRMGQGFYNSQHSLYGQPRY